jgi:hypothetical protein
MFSDCVGLYLARAGLGELLMSLLDKHRPAVYDDELRNLMKMACDVLIHILNGGETFYLSRFSEIIKFTNNSEKDILVFLN